MAAKQIQEEELGTEPMAADCPEPASSVQLSRKAVFDRTMAQINADLAAGRCSRAEAAARTHDAIWAKIQHQFPPEKHAEMRKAMELMSTHPKVQEVFRLDE